MRDVNTRLIAVIISQYIQKSLYYISEINMLHVNYISIQFLKDKNKKEIRFLITLSVTNRKYLFVADIMWDSSKILKNSGVLGIFHFWSRHFSF